MIYLLALILGVTMVIFGVLFLLFPRALETISNAMSQVVIRVESDVSKMRFPLGVLLIVLGAWIVWTAVCAKS